MKSYEERFKDASNAYKAGILKVKTTPEPEGQKFHIGERVYITDKMPPYMSHFEHGCKATVDHTHAHAYGGDDVKSYSLNIDRQGISAWYKEDQLTLLEKKMKVYIDAQEYFPVYGLYGSDMDGILNKEVEIPESLWHKYILVHNEWRDMQKELSKYWSNK